MRKGSPLSYQKVTSFIYAVQSFIWNRQCVNASQHSHRCRQLGKERKLPGIQCKKSSTFWCFSTALGWLASQWGPLWDAQQKQRADVGLEWEKHREGPPAPCYSDVGSNEDNRSKSFWNHSAKENIHENTGWRSGKEKSHIFLNQWAAFIYLWSLGYLIGL